MPSVIQMPKERTKRLEAIHYTTSSVCVAETVQNCQILRILRFRNYVGPEDLSLTTFN